MYYVYVLRCRDGSLYTGSAADVGRRLRAHALGRGARYTRGRRPVALAYWEAHPTRRMALAREASIKRWRTDDKWRLVTGRG